MCGVCRLITCHVQVVGKKRRKHKTPPIPSHGEKGARMTSKHTAPLPVYPFSVRSSIRPRINACSRPRIPRIKSRMCMYRAVAKRTERGIVMRRKRYLPAMSSMFRPSPVPAPPLLCDWVVSEPVKAPRAFARFAYARAQLAQVGLMSVGRFPRPRAVVVWCARKYSVRSGASFCMMRRCY